ncbi:MAG: HD domain-containing protein [Chloroflexi bacterium]|nr:HD domain-containing protein [Chloroflexota bacterium]
MSPLFDETTGSLLKAIHFSADKHRDQRRKNAIHSPYINHPIEVTQWLWDVGGIRDSTTLISAVLHDTLEDTQTTKEEITLNFGDMVLAVVLEVTDDKSLPKLVRKKLQIEHAPNMSFHAKLIKLADKSCNLSDLILSPPSLWNLERKKNYLRWTEEVVAGLRGTNAALENKYDEILQNGKLIFEIN